LKAFGTRRNFVLVTNFALNHKERAEGNLLQLRSMKSITETPQNLVSMRKSRDTRDHTNTMAAV